MSYSYHRSLGGLTATDAYPAGAQVVGGFTVTGLASKDAGSAVQKLREAVAANFPMGSAASAASGSRDAVNWGPAYGVPSGRLYALITLNRDGVTGGEINSAFAAVARDLSSRLGGLAVALSNVHTYGGATPLPALVADVLPDGSLAPSGGSLSPTMIAGVAGVLLIPLAGLAYVLIRRRPVTRNRSRSRRRR